LKIPSAFRRVGLVTVLTSGLLGIAATPALAATQGSCPASDHEKVLLWENQAGDTSDGNDNYWKCGSDSDLNSGDGHTLPGDCNARVIPATSWNDCATSVSVWVPDNRKLCFYAGANYSSREGPIIVGPVSGSRVFLPPHAGIYDWLSSFRFINEVVPC
jgi:hypothetical protein